MAKKRKKLNKPLAILLSVSGLLVVMLVVTVVMGTKLADRLFPPDSEKVAAEAKRLLDGGEYELAIKEYDRAADYAKANKADHLMAAADARLTWLEKDPPTGDAQKAALFHGALNTYRMAVRHRSKFVAAQRKIAALEFEIARQSNNWMEYIRCLDDLHGMVPDDPDVLFGRAMAKARLAQASPDYDAPATADFAKAVEMAPSEEKYRVILGAFHRQRNRPAEAEKVYLEGIKAIPNSVDLRVACAEFYQGQDRNVEALAMLREAVRVQSDDVVKGYLALANYFQRQRDLPKAVDELIKALEIEPGNHLCVDRLARLRLAMEGEAAAEKVLVQGVADAEKAAAATAAELDKLGATDESAMSDEAKTEHRKLEVAMAAKLRDHRVGVVILNDLLCDLLLGRIGAGGADAAALRQRAEEALAKMQAINDQAPQVLKAQGRMALLDGDIRQAEQLLRRAYDRLRSVGAFDLMTATALMGVYQRLNQLGEAEKIIRQFLMLNPENPRAIITMARLNLDYHKYEAAYRDVTQALTYNANAPADSQLKPEKLEEALQLKGILEALTERAPRLPESVKSLSHAEANLLIRWANQKWMEGERDAALTMVTDIVNRRPTYLPGIVQLIRWYRQADRAEKADEILALARKVFKDSPETLVQLSLALEDDPARRLAYELAGADKETAPFTQAMQKASIYSRFGMEKEFVEQLKLAEAKQPDHPAVVEQLFRIALKSSDFEAAQKYADIAAAKDIDDVEGRMFRAQLAMARNELDEAIRLISETLKIRPRYNHAHWFLGRCYLQKGRLDLARQAFQAAQQLNPSEVNALLGLMEIADREGKPMEHARWVEEAYRARPDHPTIRENYLQLQESRQKPEDVIRHREQIYRTQPNNLTNLARLGPLYERVRQYAKAEGAYRQLARLTNNSPQALRMLVRLLQKTDRDLEARSILSQCAEQAEDKVTAYLLWAEYLENAGDLALARLRLMKVIELAEKGNIVGHQAMAEFEARRGNWSEAVSHQRQVLDGCSDNFKAQAERTLISYLIESGDQKQADQLIEAALKKDPRDVEMLVLRGVAAFSQRNFARAKQSLDHVLTLSSGNANALMYRAQVHLSEGNKNLALDDLEAAQRSSRSPAVPMQIVAIYDSMEDFHGAYSVLRALLNDQPGFMPALYASVQLCRRYQKWNELGEVLTLARKTYPQEEDFLLYQAEALQELKRPAQAVQLLQAARQVLPSSVKISLALAEAMTEAGQYDQALTAAQAYRDHHDFGTNAIALCGRAYQGKNDPAKADAEFQEALKRAATRPQINYVVSHLRKAHEGDLPKAIERLSAWVDIRPGGWEIPLLLGEMCMVQEDFAKARQVLERSLANAKEPSERFEVLRQLGLACRGSKQYDQAKAFYEQALAISPNDKICLNNLAWTLAFDLNQIDAALAPAERAYRQAPFNAHALDTYGVILQAKVRLEEAEEILRRSVNLLPMAANRYHLGELLEQRGQKPDALQEYKAAWDLAKDAPPDDEYRQKIRKALERLGEPPEERTQP